MNPPRLHWPAILERGREIVEAFETAVTLRQLFYLLVSERLIPNAHSAYKRLSALTAEARRDYAFPPLIDRTRGIRRAASWTSPRAAVEWLGEAYRRDRTAGQEVALFLGAEKDTVGGLLEVWFEDLGVRIVALRGYSSESLAEDVRAEIGEDGRRPVLIYAGDFDATGEDVDRDFVERVGMFRPDDFVRVAVNAEQITQYGLPPLPGKRADSRAAAFEARHGELVQVEVEALPPDVLRGLYQDAIDRYLDRPTFEAVRAREEEEADELRGLADGLPPDVDVSP